MKGELLWALPPASAHLTVCSGIKIRIESIGYRQQTLGQFMGTARRAIEMAEHLQRSDQRFHPAPLGPQSHLSPAPSAIAAKDERAGIGFFRIPFTRRNRRRYGIATARALKEKNVNERFSTPVHGNLPRLQAY
jgi:hypothetical protein